MRNNQLNQTSSPEQSRDAAQSVFNYLSDFFFDRINFISLPFSQAQEIDASDNLVDVTAQDNYWATSRLPDTSKGKLFRPDKVSRMRCHFYLSNGANIDGYIFTPAVFDNDFSLNELEQIDFLRSYVGLKFLDGVSSIVIKEAGGEEVLYPVEIDIDTSGASETFVFEVRFFVSYSDIYINNELIGSFSSDLVGDDPNFVTFLPMMSPVRSTDGNAVNIVIENYQFIQDR